MDPMVLYWSPTNLASFRRPYTAVKPIIVLSAISGGVRDVYVRWASAMAKFGGGEADEFTNDRMRTPTKEVDHHQERQNP